MREMIDLLLATRNAHKTQEFAALLGAGFKISDLRHHPNIPAVAETGTTYEENAILKALAASRAIAGLVVSDDSGLEVDQLGGAPGIYSARYAGENASDGDNVTKLLSELKKHGCTGPRLARFVCVLALTEAETILAVFRGVVVGRIMIERRGKTGFGYDPIFIPEGFDQTFAELGDAAKNRISHRAQAVVQLRKYLRRTKPPNAADQP
jgi:XTP/dITP diphosphohydrolase